MKTRRVSGFSLTELVVAMAVAMVLMAVSMPYFMRAYHSYQLSNAATQMADILRLTRYEAIRRNRTVNCLIRPDAANPAMTDALMTDVNRNPLTGMASRMVLLGPSGFGARREFMACGGGAWRNHSHGSSAPGRHHSI